MNDSSPVCYMGWVTRLLLKLKISANPRLHAAHCLSWSTSGVLCRTRCPFSNQSAVLGDWKSYVDSR